MGRTKTDNLIIQKQNQNDLRTLEQQFVDSKVGEMQQYIEKQKENIVQQLIEYKEKHTVESKWDKYGDPIAFEVRINPMVISNYFFKSICPISSVEPMYNAEKLGLVFDYYMYLISEVNDKIGNYPSSLTSFCKLAGITLNTLRSYRSSDDLNMRIIAEKIYDQVGDENITMSQMGITKERSTMFKLRSQNEITEAQRPTVSINFSEQINTEQIEDRIKKYQSLAAKKK